MWKEEQLYLGNIEEKSSHDLIFKWIGPGKLKFKKAIPSCGCTVPEWDEENQQLTANFKAGKVPVHLLHKGNFTTTKTIRVIDEDKNIHELKFTATINK